MTTNLPRRRFLGMAAAATVSSGLAATSVQASNSPASPDSLRFAHLPDIHMLPGRGAPQKFARCLGAVEDSKPKFAITGGDHVYNVLRVSEAEALGFSRCIVPQVDLERWTGPSPSLPLHGVKTVAEALEEVGLGFNS